MKRLLYTSLGLALAVAFGVWAQQSGSGLPGGAVNTTQVKLNGTSFGGVGPGAAGEVLTSNGAGMLPSYQPAAAGGCAPAGMADEVLLDDGAGGCDSLANGSNGDVLTIDAGVPIWQAAGGTLSGTFSATFTAACTTDYVQDFSYLVVSNIVYLTATTNPGNCASDSTSFSTAAGSAPAAIRPNATRRSLYGQAGDNSVFIGACISIASDGTISYQTLNTAQLQCLGAASWTAAGSKRVASQVQLVVYSLN
jgi:hypothetical protein